jgi:hypothetical protein
MINAATPQAPKDSSLTERRLMEYDYLRTLSDSVMLVGLSMISLGRYTSTKSLILLNVSLGSLPIDMISLPTRM